MKRPTAFMALFVSVALASPIEALRAQESAAPAGGVYLELRAEQTRLVDDWFAVYNEVTGESMDPRIEYDRLPTAIRTTYEAVTHALMNSPLTAEDGLPLGTALDVVAHVETVTGDVMRSHSDEQFRIYVKLEPDALQRLSASREFTRRGDNTVFHVGYPLNFRQLGGVPSIQVSCARDGTRADIDVDYRSSTFPASLFNGHLTTANSDVRAGSNYTRHRGRWLGLVDWWRSFFDIGPRPEPRVGGPEIVPEFPRHRAGSPLEYVAYDFLATWLVEGTPQDALPYFSPQAYACLDRPGDEGDGIPVGFEMWAILREMHKANDLLGPRATLQDATVGVEPTGPGFRTMHQLHDDKFAQFEIRNDVAAELLCANRLAQLVQPAGAPPTADYGTFFGTAFRFRASGGKSSSVVLIWVKDPDQWRIVSWLVEPAELDRPRAPDISRPGIPATATRPERAQGDSEFVSAAQAFFMAWLQAKDVQTAMAFLSPRSYECLSLEADQSPVESAAEAAARIEDRMRAATEHIGPVTSLEHAIVGFDPRSPDLRPISHQDSDAYTLLTIPDAAAEAFDCQRRGTANPLAASEQVEGPASGRYFGTLFRINIPGDPAVLALLWAREEEQWRIVAYSVESP